MTDITVDVLDLRKHFGGFKAVDGISLNVRKGEVFGFLGPNGAGKSTTIRMLCGLLLPTSGGGTVAGFDIIKQSEEIKKSIGYMSQRFSLYDDLTVYENLNFFGGVYGVGKTERRLRIEHALEMSGLTERRKEITRTLPSGMKQRLALGCSMLHKPDVLFLDEPTSGVDPISRRNFWGIIYSMSKSGTTVFVTTHYMDEADYCDRLALIYKGVIIAEGTPGELKSGHNKDVFEAEVDDTLAAIDALESAGFAAAVFGNRLHISAYQGGESVDDIRKVIDGAGLSLKLIEKIVPSLEDVFVSMIEAA